MTPVRSPRQLTGHVHRGGITRCTELLFGKGKGKDPSILGQIGEDLCGQTRPSGLLKTCEFRRSWRLGHTF